MLHALEGFLGIRVMAEDGEIGKAYDFFVDDFEWRLRYLVVETGNWLHRRRVLIAPQSLRLVNGPQHELLVKLTRREIEGCPDEGTERPVSRQQEQRLVAHYGWHAYWVPSKVVIPDSVHPVLRRRSNEWPGNPHLRSIREIRTYSIASCGSEGMRGRVRDFLIDDLDWSVRLLVGSVGRWFDSHPVTIPTECIREVSWPDQEVTVELPVSSTAALEMSPLSSFREN